MDAWTWIVIAIIAVVVIAALLAIIAAARQRRRHRVLHDRFGDEYDRTIEGADKRRHGERELQDRIDLRERFRVRPLAPAARDRYTEQWRETQTRFVDQPTVAVAEADTLVNNVMRERGYPVDDWDQQAAVVSVDHPQIVDDYRVAHDIAGRSGGNNVSTEELREAFLRYRSLFDALLETDERVAEDERDTTVRR
jgi:Ni/Co efflux regulator RcnB